MTFTKPEEFDVEQHHPDGEWTEEVLRLRAENKMNGEEANFQTARAEKAESELSEVKTHLFAEVCNQKERAEKAESELAAFKSHDRCNAGMRSRLKTLEEENARMAGELERGREAAENIVASWVGLDFGPDMIALQKFAALKQEAE